MGPPGVGKGTQRKMFIDKYSSCGSIVPGDLLRAEIKNETQIGKKLKSILAQGSLAPHEIVMDVVAKTLALLQNQGVKNIIFDGFPREMEQALALNTLLQQYPEYEIKKVLLFTTSDDEVFKRIRHRATIESRDDDKDENVVRKRLAVFSTTTSQVVDYYRNANILQEIEATKGIEDVFENVDMLLSPFV